MYPLINVCMSYCKVIYFKTNSLFHMSNVFMILLHFYHELNRVIASCYSYKSSDNFGVLFYALLMWFGMCIRSGYNMIDVQQNKINKHST